MNKKKYLTSPIFYANSVPHIGHLYTGLICDLWKQSNAVAGYNVVFGSGMDEHGQKVFQSSQANGYKEQDYVDIISDKFQKFFEKNSVKYDRWVRTSAEYHEKAAQQFWQKLNDNGYIYKSRYEGWYSISDENYLDVPKDYVATSANIVWREEECYYFKLSAFQEKLLKFYENNVEFVYPKTRYNETIGFLKQGLKDFSISRPKDRLSWGIPVPNDSNQVMYVWIDALTSYLTLVDYPKEVYKEYWPAIHVIGKDILKFHTIYWPALLMAAEVELPKKVIVHGWWLNGDQKISKSLNNAIDIEGLTKEYGIDCIRYFLLSNMTLGEDGNFKETIFNSAVNSVLSNKFGNLFLRLSGMAIGQEFTLLKVCELDNELQIFIESLISENKKFVEDITYFDEYMQLFITALDFLNNYINQKAIWRKPLEELKESLYCVFYCFKVVGVLFSPILPEASKKIAEYFNVELLLSKALNHEDIAIKKGVILFPRVNIE